MEEKSPPFDAPLTVDPALRATKSDFFSTSIYDVQLPASKAAALNAQLLFAIEKERQKDRAGLVRSNLKPLGGWHSRADLHHRPDYTALIDLIAQICAQIETENNYDTAYPLSPTALWAIINPPGSANRAHVHPSSLWSGAYYAKAPKNCGDIEFTDPRVANVMLRPRFNAEGSSPKSAQTTRGIQPKAGKLLIFPSWLYHSVAPNLSLEQGANAERVVFSFNLSQLRRADPEAAKN